jgi:hypothetical protein
MKVDKIAALACAVALGLGTAGCGSDSPGGGAALPAADPPKVEQPKLDPVAAVRDAADKTRSAGSSRLTMEINATTGGQAIEISAKGAFDYKNGIGELQLSLPAQTGLKGVTLRQIITKKALYLAGVPGLAEGKWIKVPVDQLDRAGGSGGLTSNDPSAVLEMVRGVSDDVKEVGKATVRGEQTTHYRGKIDLKKAVASAPAETREQVKQYLKQADTAKVPFELFVDDDGRLRKLVQEFELEGLDGSGAVEMELTLELYDYGVKVDVDEPPAAQVIEPPSGSLGGSGSG